MERVQRSSARTRPQDRTTDPNGHTPVSVRLDAYYRPRYPPKSDGRPFSDIAANPPANTEAFQRNQDGRGWRLSRRIM